MKCEQCAQDSRHRVAMHEAGHAVVAHRLKLYCGGMTIDPTAENLGSSVSETEWADGSMDAEQIMVLFAGWESERRYCENANHDGSESDEELAAELLKWQPAGSEERLRAQTGKMVEDDHEAIHAVAEALLEAGTFKDDDWTIIIDAIDEGYDWRFELEDLRRRKPVQPRPAEDE